MATQPEITITTALLNSSPGGIHARFVDLGKYGMKIYRSDIARDAQFNNQCKLHELGVAMACWDCFDFDGPAGETLYAFYTEKAEVYNRADRAKMSGDDGHAYDARFERCIDDLRSLLYDKGIEWSDDHLGNCGFDSDGCPVLIDCDFLDDEDGSLEYVGCGAVEEW